MNYGTNFHTAMTSGIMKNMANVAIFLYFITGRFALAALENPLVSGTFADLIANIAKIVAQIGVPIAVIAIIWAGFLFVSSGGSEEKLKKAKETFFWAIMGTALLLGAWALADAIRQFMLTL